MSSSSSEQRKKVRVGISELPPFVEISKHTIHGFEIQLWETIAKHLDVEYEYVPTSLKSLIQRIHAKRLDIGIAGISKTADREKVIDFTHTTYKSGLHILIPSSSRVRVMRSLISRLREHWRRLIATLFGFGAFVAVMGHLIWFLEKGHHFHTDYIQGLGDGMWYVMATISTVGYGDLTPVTFWGRCAGVFLIVVGYVIFAIVVAQLNSIFVYEKLHTAIQEPADLRGKRVVTIKGTISESLLEKYEPMLLTVDHLSKAMTMLEKNQADALVFDAPVLQHYIKRHGTKRFRIVGAKFDEHDYGMIVSEHSPWREAVNRTLLGLIESGEYDAIYRQWFGGST